MTDWYELKKKFDSSNFYSALHNFPDAMEKSVALFRNLKIEGRSVKNVLVCGMGGSAIPGHIAKDFCNDQLKVSFEVISNYDLPDYVNEHTLVFVISYSGNTEESISCYTQALNRNAFLISITTGGVLAELCLKNKTFCVLIPKTSQPRGALSYMLVPLLEIMRGAGLIQIDYAEALKNLKKMEKRLSIGTDFRNNAKKVSKMCVNRLPIIYSCSFDSLAIRLRAQGINENSKMIVHANVIPEMNHNELTAWQSAQSLPYTTIFLKDEHANKRNLKRLSITKELLEKKVPKNFIFEIKSSGRGILSRLLTLVYQCDMISYYTALLHGVDPTNVEYVELLKKKMGQK